MNDNNKNEQLVEAINCKYPHNNIMELYYNTGRALPFTAQRFPDVFDFRVVWKDKLDDAGRNVETKLSVLGVTWFIDRNGNGKFDAGEDANIFDAKGNALPNTVYSGVLALAAEDNANVRFADPCRLYLGGGNYALIDESNLTVTFTLGADFYELHTGMILPTGGATGRILPSCRPWIWRRCKNRKAV